MPTCSSANSGIVATRSWLVATIAIFSLGIAGTASAVQPDAKTVPWVPSNPLIPHDAFSGEATTLKCTSSVAGSTIQYQWDFGDGSPLQLGTVTAYGAAIVGSQRMQYAIEATKTYAGSVGTVFTARCTVRDTSTGESDTASYLVEIRQKNLATEVNVAIDKGLWLLHKAMLRNAVDGVDTGDWLSFCPQPSVAPCQANGVYRAVTANNLTAFLANGHVETGSADNPYTETVQRATRRLFQLVSAVAIPSSQTNPKGTFNPDSNGNGIGINPAGGQANEFYQSGMVIDAMVATGQPDRLTVTGGANVLGRKYRDIVQDIVDYLSYCQYDGATGARALGGWRYSCNAFPDSSANQWAAIGLIAAERSMGSFIAPAVRAANFDWIGYAQAADGSSGYTSPSSIWGPFATTASAQVQNVFAGAGRGDATWDNGETFLRDRFCTGAVGATVNIKDYYYGLFSFTKSMLLHDSNADRVAEPLQFLQSATPGVAPIDWYAAEVSAGAPCDGVARTLVGDQNAAGYWSGHDFDAQQFPFETGWAILMLNRAVFEAGQPVAVIAATPNPAVAFQVIQLSGADSFHQDSTRAIASWEWDLDNNGTFEASGVLQSVSFPVIGLYPIKLRVCDNGDPRLCDDATLSINVATPPLAPTANAGGPYNFCPNRTPYFLDGSASNNPDEGQSEPGRPGNTIVAYDWDLDGDAQYDDASGVQPNVTAMFPAPGAFLIQLRVTDNTAASFPSSGQPNLADTDSAIVNVRAATDPACSCVSNLAARPKSGKVQLTWSPQAGLPAGGRYNVYRGTITGGPYLKIAETMSSYSTYLDTLVVNGTRYFYIVRPSSAAGEEICQSNEANARPAAR